MKKNKRLRRLKTFLLASPFLVYYRFRLRNFRQISELLSMLPFSIGKNIRGEFYRRTLSHCGENVSFGFGTIINYPDISVGDNTSFNRFNNIGKVDFGNNVLTATGCNFLSGKATHEFGDRETPINQQKANLKRITVGNDVWVGTNAVIMESVGDGCVIGAGSVVTKPVEPYSVAVGNPARVIRKR